MQELSLKSVVTGLIEQCIQIITNAIKKNTWIKDTMEHYQSWPRPQHQ